MISKLTIIMPAYNESAYIKRCLENVINAKGVKCEIEILVVDDGSTDDTQNILKELIERNEIKYFEHDKNLGKGAAIRTGLKNATGDIVIIQDADLEYDPNDYEAILEEYKKPNVTAVYGSRITGAKIYHNYSANALFYFGGKTLTKIVNLFFKTKLTDQPTGYKSWRSEMSKYIENECKSNGFEFEVELTASLARRTFIREVPIHYYPRTVSHGKKIQLTDFLKSVWSVYKCSHTI